MDQKNEKELKRASQQQNLKSYDTFHFDCRKGIKCFNQCCADVNVILTPYDVLRMKNRLGISSEEFLTKYTTTLRPEKGIFPIVALKMKDNEAKECFFVSEEGCQIYEDRPWACRMFPLDKAESEGGETTFRMIKKPGCLGFEEEKVWTVEDWILDQGINVYEKFESFYQELTESERAKGLDITNPDVYHMIHLATYNLDKFRKFVFESNFLNYFEVEKGRIETIRNDDAELFVFGIDWIKFGLFGQQTLSVKEHVANEWMKELEKKGLLKQSAPQN